MDPRASIVIPLAGSADQARRCLEGVAAQPAEPSFEVIVVADAAPWLEPLLAALEGDVQIVRADRPLGPTGALALGLQRAAAPITAILTEGAVPGPGWLRALVDALSDPDVGTAYSPASGAQGPASALTAPAAAWRTAQAREALAAPPAGTPPVATIALALAERGLRTAAVADAPVLRPSPGATLHHAPGTAPELCAVIPTLDPTSERITRCVTALHAGTDAPHEIVIVDNGSPPQGFSEPVNAGLRAARAPYVVVMNDDVEVLPGWWEPLRAALDDGAAVAFPLTVDGAMRTDFAAWCFAARTDTLREFGHAPGAFFDPSLVIWFQDTDLLVRLRRAGRPPELVPASRIRHGLSQTLADPEPQLSDWIRRQILTDQERFRAKHPQVQLVERAVA